MPRKPKPPGTLTANKVLEWYRDEGDMEWEKRQAKVPQQGNQEDCGVAVLMAMRRRVLIRRRPRNEREWGYGATDYPRMRWKMAEELMHDEVQWGRDTVHTQIQRVMDCEEAE
jgi:Ulp1 family protease